LTFAMLDAFIPSLIIVASTVTAFVVGRGVAWGSARMRITRVARVIVFMVAIGFALFFWYSPASRYALLLPAGFAVGFFLYGGRRMAPRVFDRE